MFDIRTLILTLLVLGSGVAVGYILRILIATSWKNSLELDIKRRLSHAHEEAKRITLEAETRAVETMKSAREEVKEKADALSEREERLLKKEEAIDTRQKDIDKRTDEVRAKIDEVRNVKERVDTLYLAAEEELERVANLTQEEALGQIVRKIELDAGEDLLMRAKKLELFAEDQLKERAKQILAITIQRLASSVTADAFTSLVPIPSDDIKGKIIGKEGRNIKTFERETGVEVLVDETPGSIMLSCFDPVRRQIAKIALEALVSDGRVQPARIEKEIEIAREEINKVIKEQGERAAYEAGVIGLDPRLLTILGRLHFRTSYGQNVLQHSIECAHIAGMIAEELKANVKVARAGALLHDIGKALDHEVTGSHVEIGIRILQKFGVSDDVMRAMRAHHEEYPYETVESRIVQTADAISGGRPGARRDSIENYLKRLEDLESIANSFEGIDKSYALQAGREIRVFVSPTQMTDFESQQLARAIALRIEDELRYPGEIKVTVIRESRIIEFAR